MPDQLLPPLDRSPDVADATPPSVSVGRVAGVDELAVGAMKMATVDGHRVVLARTAAGYCALDNACPHQGYGLATGAFDGELVTCQWHNWKFDVTTGGCVQGEEDVAVHRVEVVDPTSDPARPGGDDRPPGIYVEVRQPDADEARARLWPSLQRGIESLALGQIARDTARLLATGATPHEIVERAVADNLRRTEWGPDHELAVLADVVTLIADADADGTGRAGDSLDPVLALVHGLAGLAEATHRRPARAREPSPAGPASAHRVDAARTSGPRLDGIALADVDPPAGRHASFAAAIEAEDHATAGDVVVALVGDAQIGDLPTRLARAASWFTAAVGRHHLSYGHGAIYVHKAFELLDHLPSLAPLVVDELAVTIVNATREDTLPYMRTTARSVAAADVIAMAASADAAASTPMTESERAAVVAELVAADDPRIQTMVDVGRAHGVEAVLDIVSLASAQRMMDHDLAVEIDPSNDFGWLDITHALTYAEAARGLWRRCPGPDAARLALWTVWLVFDAGRQRRRAADPSRDLDAAPTAAVADEATGEDLRTAILSRDVAGAVALARALPVDTVACALEQAALDDAAGSFIVAAHAIKTAVAARREQRATGDRAPLVAVARFLAAPRMERFVARTVAESVDFVRTGRPPTR